MADLEAIKEKVQKGDAPGTKELVKQGLEAGDDPKELFFDGLIAGMKIVIDKFKRNEAYIPEVLIAARANDAGMELIQPELAKLDYKPKARLLLGTVKGDLHDIGKNLVGMSFRGQGYEVVDLGVDQAEDTFVQAAKDNSPDVIGLSALLTTTMPQMKIVIDALKDGGIEAPVIIGVTPKRPPGGLAGLGFGRPGRGPRKLPPQPHDRDPPVRLYGAAGHAQFPGDLLHRQPAEDAGSDDSVIVRGFVVFLNDFRLIFSGHHSRSLPIPIRRAHPE